MIKSKQISTIVCDVCGADINTTSNNTVDICSNCSKELSEVNNFDKLSSLLEFPNEDTFYWIQVLKRRKDNPEMQENSKICGTYWIFNKSELLDIKDELIYLSNIHNARVVLWVNPRNAKEINFKCAQLALEYYQSGQYKAVKHLTDSVCGKTRSKVLDKRYIIDVDTKDPEYLNTIVETRRACVKDTSLTLETIIPTIHGYHIICTGFDKQEFYKILADRLILAPVIQDDNPTLLYYKTSKE